MALLDTLTDAVESRLLGFTSRTPRMTTLSENVAASGAVTFAVDDMETLTRGPLQIGEELLMVTSFNGTTATVPAWGRGYANSTAAAHSTGDRVVIAPPFPRHEIKQAIIETVDGLWPELYGLGKTTITLSGVQETYELPTGTQDVIKVTYEDDGPSGTWPVLRSWRFNRAANLTDYPTGRSITLPIRHLTPGRKVDILVEVKPELTSLISDWDDIGLFESARQVVVYGALYRILAVADLGTLDGKSASSAFAQRSEAFVSASDLARQFYAYYREALEAERNRMNKSYAPQMHFEG